MNIFIQLLSLLKIKHTKVFASKYYGEHPYKYTLYGISQMLSDYKVPNVGLQLNDKDEIKSLQTPFIAQAANDFVLVTNISNNNVTYIWRDKKLNVSIDKFKDIWTGVALIANPDEKSIEPDYSKHILKERFVFVEKIIFVMLAISLACLQISSTENINLWERLAFILINGIGLYVSYLLLLKQLNISSRPANKICSLFAKSDCNDVLEMPAAKILGMIGWSEIGFSYFLSNMLVIIFFPNLLLYLGIINILALPYTLWSIWYQKFRAKQWCALCLIVQIVLWLSFFTFWAFRNIGIPIFILDEMVIIASIFAIPLLSINFLLQKFGEAKKVEEITQEFASLRLKDEVFLTYLKLQKHYDVDKTTSSILFGNPNSGLLVTILTNPHCNPCASMHKRTEILLNDYGDDLCIQYIFSSFNDELDKSGKFLTALYINHSNDMNFIKSCFDSWFASGKNNRDIYFDKYNEKIDSEAINQEYSKHILWREQNKLNTTPTILVNGYELPNNYVIEDLRYFLSLYI